MLGRWLGFSGMLLLVCWNGIAAAGMPAPLPTSFVMEPGEASGVHASGFDPRRLQAISFFAMLLLLTGFGVQRLWNSLTKDFPALPTLTYRRALSLTLLWGSLFVVVLAMISGARELMTPGAWRKTGWTYQLNAADRPAGAEEAGFTRRQALEQLRLALWNYALAHEGKLPTSQHEPLVPAVLWQLPEHPLLTFVYQPDAAIGDPASLIVAEPAAGNSGRLVLWGDGRISEVTSATILKHWTTPVATMGEMP